MKKLFLFCLVSMFFSYHVPCHAAATFDATGTWTFNFNLTYTHPSGTPQGSIIYSEDLIISQTSASPYDEFTFGPTGQGMLGHVYGDHYVIEGPTSGLPSFVPQDTRPWGFTTSSARPGYWHMLFEDYNWTVSGSGDTLTGYLHCTASGWYATEPMGQLYFDPNVVGIVTEGTFTGTKVVPIPPANLLTANFADYYPLGLGSYWKYQNTANPSDTYTVSVFEQFVYEGKPALKVGTDNNNYGIGYNKCDSVAYYGEVDDGVLEDFTNDISLGEFSDGDFFNVGEPTNFILFRMWDNLDPAQKSIYNIDPSLSNLLLEVTYDSNYKGNSQNQIVESNLSVAIPDYSVTHLKWYQAGVGEIVKLDVNAADGALGKRYELIKYDIAHNWARVDPGAPGPGNGGFGDNNNEIAVHFTQFNGYLYSSTSNAQHGGEIWRSPDGVTWEKVVSGGFDDPTNINISWLLVFKNCLYAAVDEVSDENTTGLSVWRSCNGTDFEKVLNVNPTNENCNLGYFGDYLYAGTDKDDPSAAGELWRSPDGVNWTPVTLNGFGNPTNNQIIVRTFPYGALYDGYIYVGTENDTNGCEIWRSADGVNWSPVLTGGGGDYTNGTASLFTVFKGCLYVCIGKEGRGNGAGELWKSCDGTTFKQVGKDGFGDLKNESLIPVSLSDAQLYVGTENATTGGQLWKSTDGINFVKDAPDGFGNQHNIMIMPPLVLFNCSMYCGTGNQVTGGEVWRSSDGNSKELLTITKFTAKAGKGASKDSLSFSGTLDATEGDLLMADGNDITVVINANDMTEPMEFKFPINSTSFKKGKYNYARTENASQSFFKLDTKNGKMQFNAKNVDLTGLACPITVTITIGDYTAECDVNEDIVNGPKKPCPLQFLMHVRDTLTVSKVKVKRGKNPNMDSITVTGFFTIAGDYSKSNVFSVTLGDNTYTIAGGQMSTKGSVEGCKKVSSNEGGLMTANIDFTKCTFAITIAKTTVGKGETVPFGLNVFGSELGGAEIDLLR